MLIHQMLNTLCTCVLPLDLAIHITYIFVIEGQKSLLRIIFAILAINKELFLEIKEKRELMPKLREQCKNLTIDEIVQKAYDI